MLLWGSSGTGKTLALVAALKRKVSYYKRRKIPYKVLVCSFGAGRQNCKQLLNDLKTKYGLQTILEESETEPMILRQLEEDLKSISFAFEESLEVFLFSFLQSMAFLTMMKMHLTQ